MMTIFECMNVTPDSITKFGYEANIKSIQEDEFLV